MQNPLPGHRSSLAVRSGTCRGSCLYETCSNLVGHQALPIPPLGRRGGRGALEGAAASAPRRPRRAALQAIRRVPAGRGSRYRDPSGRTNPTPSYPGRWPGLRDADPLGLGTNGAIAPVMPPPRPRRFDRLTVCDRAALQAIRRVPAGSEGEPRRQVSFWYVRPQPEALLNPELRDLRCHHLRN